MGSAAGSAPAKALPAPVLPGIGSSIQPALDECPHVRCSFSSHNFRSNLQKDDTPVVSLPLLAKMQRQVLMEIKYDRKSFLEEVCHICIAGWKPPAVGPFHALPSFSRPRKYLWSSASLKQKLRQGCRWSGIQTVCFFLAIQMALNRGFWMQQSRIHIEI